MVSANSALAFCSSFFRSWLRSPWASRIVPRSLRIPSSWVRMPSAVAVDRLRSFSESIDFWMFARASQTLLWARSWAESLPQRDGVA